MKYKTFGKFAFVATHFVFCYVWLTNNFTSGQTVRPSMQPEAYFNGSTYIRLYPFLSLKRPIGLSFRTCSEGLLFYESSSGTYIQLGVAANGITFKAHAKGKVFEELIMGNYSDNRWHNVYFTFVMGNLTISIDGKDQVIANRSYRTELLTMPEFYNEQFVVIIGKQYTGCIIEGPSIVFNETNMLPYGVIFGKCPIDEDTCTVRLDNDKDKGFNYCSTEPCMGHGYCKSINGTYNCTCTPRYTGRNCELDMGSPCNRAPPICRNSGRCSEDERGNYNCRCSPTFTGQHCETVIETDPLCSPNPCVNGGSCTGIVETNNVYCACASGFTGQYCEKSINECKMSPCKNRGTCIDTPDNFTCDCDNTGYQGRVCEINVNECFTAKPCLNNGQCFDNPGGYFCACPNGFSGQNCQDKVNECLSQPCLNNGRCDDKSGDYECYCPAGYKGQNCEMPVHETSQCDTCGPLGMCSDDGSSCVCKPEYSGLFPNCKPRTCNGNTCQNGGTCVLYSDSFNCTCPPGYKGSACERSATCLTHACRNGGTCFEDLHSHNCLCPNGFKGLYCDQRVKCVDRPCTHDTECIDFPQGYYCSCEPGWSGLNCDTNVDECLSNPCFNNGTCVDRVPFFVCECLPGFSGERCQFTGDCDCLNGGTCLNTVNGNVCKCTESYAGIKCERSINVCEGKCLNGGVCKVGPNKIDYTCECPSGFQGANCEITYDTYNDLCAKVTCPKHSDCTVAPGTYNYSCECHMGFAGPNCDDIDECAEQSGVCNNGICKNLIGGFQCYCQPGYTGEKCTLDINECLSLPCENNGNCLDEINNYRCVCPPGFTGKTCAVDIDECESNPCQYDSVCDDRINGFICICNPGLTGIFCDTNIDDCLSKPCRNGGSCEDGLNNYTCNCTNTGYTGYDCEENIDDCFSNPCVNGGTCHDRINNYVCQCHNGYTGKNCETDINECLKNPCKHSGTCLERSNQTLYQSPATTVLPNRYKGSFSYNAAEGFDCLCVPGTTGETCETDVNECDSSPCKFGNCIDKLNSYSCQCDDGFEGEVCDVEINECIRYKPCLNGECRDRRANYYCDCKAGFGGKNCSVELTGCKTNPCKSNGTCIPYVVNETDHHYNCTCQNGFFGPTCETLTTMSLSGSSSILVNTTREEGYDIQFRFKTTLGEGLLVVGVGHTFCILELSKGRLNLHSSLLNKWEGVFIGSNLNDSHWQRVFVAINTSHIVLSANDEQTIYPITNTDNNTSVTSFPTTYIGGNPNEAKALTHGKPPLVGCIEDVIINSQWVLPETGSDFMRFQGVKAGCERKPRCSPNPCHSGGHCTDKWVDFSCTCERPYLGHTCQYNFTAATFGYENIKNSLATVTVDKDAKRAVRTIVDISMFIRTRQSRSQIFYLGSAIGSPKDQEETYIAAQLEGGELLVRIQFHGNPEFYTVGSVKLDNGYNHLIEVFRNVTLVQVKINGTEYFRKTISATGTLDAEVLFLGGQPGLRPVRDVTDSLPKPETAAATAPATVTTPLSMINFKGIIQDVQISNGTKIMVVEFFPLKVVDLHIPMPFGIVSFDNNTVFPGVLSDDSCKPNPCHQNASCINTWNDYQCNCNKGFKGKDCKELEFCELYPCPNGSECKNLQDGKECIANATFDGDTKPLLYQFHTTSHDDNGWAFVESLEISYRTRTEGTIFFAVLDTNYLVIYVHYKDVIFHWRMNGINETHTFRKDDFRGQWVTLYFRIKDSAIKGGFKELVNDDTPNFTQNDFDYATFSQLILNGVIYVGGSDGKSYDHTFLIKNKNAIPDTTIASVISDNNLIPQYDGKVETNELYEITSDDRFKGCLGEIRINELLVPYFPIAELYKEELPSKYFNLMGGAQHSITCQLCFNKDCNRGTCSDPFNSYVCDCPIGFTADDCSVDIDECMENQCQNNAQCIDEIGKYSCNCSLGYGGELCDHDIDECESNPCQNNATCVDLLGRFACNCTEEYIGDQCEYLRLITCSDEPCKEGSICLNKEDLKTGNNFTCECAEGMTGTVCDVPYCKIAECKNGGTCNVDVRPPRCDCQPGFEGNLCTIDIDDCASVPCLNRGVCQDRVYGYTCYCNATGYTGMNCEMDINECEQPSNPCGQGKCKNTPGAYLCTCDNQKCGYNCNFDDPCLQSPCINGGVCKSVCVNEPDYNCNCIDAWTGKNCTEYEIASPARADGFNILYIVIPIVVVIVAGLLVAFVILVNIARSKRATRGTYSPSAQEFCNPRVELDHVLKPPPEERLI